MLWVPGAAARQPGNSLGRSAPSIGQVGSSDVSSTCAIASRSSQFSSATFLCPGATTSRFCISVLVVTVNSTVRVGPEWPRPRPVRRDWAWPGTDQWRSEGRVRPDLPSGSDADDIKSPGHETPASAPPCFDLPPGWVHWAPPVPLSGPAARGGGSVWPGGLRHDGRPSLARECDPSSCRVRQSSELRSTGRGGPSLPRGLAKGTLF